MNKFKLLSIFFVVLFSLFSQNSFSKNHDDGLDDVCSLASGTWHTSASGWACCWSNWGCYGCTNGSCGMTCRTPRCKRANGTARAISSKEIEVQGLAPEGMKAPIVPNMKGPKRKIKSPDLKRKSQ